MAVMVVFVWMIGVLGTLILSVAGLICLVLSLVDRSLGALRVLVGVLCGYAAGARFIWRLVPREWTLPFGTTLAASVNAGKYGHAVEHPAQGIVVWMLFGAVVGSVAGGLLAHFASSLKARWISKMGW